EVEYENICAQIRERDGIVLEEEQCDCGCQCGCCDGEECDCEDCDCEDCECDCHDHEEHCTCGCCPEHTPVTEDAE
ncbi:MAG: hypothetical protein J6R34_00450, partial [Clostridia bacterium]|nr:hypothetical protein [Clostridia bacterium]